MQNFLTRLLKWLGLAAAALVVVVLGFAAFWIVTLTRDLPSVETLQDYQPPITTRVYAGNGTVLGEYAHERRIFVPVAFVPKLVKEAFTSAEDRNFYNHPGIDPSGILRAAIKDVGLVLEGRRPQGASTITQQVARGFLLNSDLKMARKVREAILAIRIDATYPEGKGAGAVSERDQSRPEQLWRGGGGAELFRQVAGRTGRLRSRLPGGAAQVAQPLRSALPSRGGAGPAQLGDRPDGREWLHHRRSRPRPPRPSR